LRKPASFLVRRRFSTGSVSNVRAMLGASSAMIESSASLRRTLLSTNR
jgi:hypothetical protein